MAVKRWRWPRRNGRRRDKPEEIAERLAPLEETEAFRESEQSDAGVRANDTIRVGRDSIRMPEYLGEKERDVESTFRMDAPIVFILVAFLAFVAFIAWQISLMPDK